MLKVVALGLTFDGVLVGPRLGARGERVEVSVWDAVARDGDLRADPVVDHDRALKEGAAEENAVRLLGVGEPDAGESAKLEDLKRRDRDPGGVKGMATRASGAGDHDEVHHRQAQGLGDLNVDTALGRPGVDQGMRGVPFGRGLRRIDERGYDDLEARPEFDERGMIWPAIGVEEGRVSERHERAGTRSRRAWLCASGRQLGG